jgi:hypothetical protein
MVSWHSRYEVFVDKLSINPKGRILERSKYQIHAA